ncbi:MAG: hypothetical protein Q8P93_04355 [bacterium]|nr:hypothetical protein [bacterium]
MLLRIGGVLIASLLFGSLAQAVVPVNRVVPEPFVDEGDSFTVQSIFDVFDIRSTVANAVSTGADFVDTFITQTPVAQTAESSAQSTITTTAPAPDNYSGSFVPQATIGSTFTGTINTSYLPNASEGATNIKSIEGIDAVSHRSGPVYTAEDWYLGKVPHITLAGDPSLKNQTFEITGGLSWTNAQGVKRSNITHNTNGEPATGKVEDTGGAFGGRLDKIDFATDRIDVRNFDYERAFGITNVYKPDGTLDLQAMRGPLSERFPGEDKFGQRIFNEDGTVNVNSLGDRVASHFDDSQSSDLVFKKIDGPVGDEVPKEEGTAEEEQPAAEEEAPKEELPQQAGGFIGNVACGGAPWCVEIGAQARFCYKYQMPPKGKNLYDNVLTCNAGVRCLPADPKAKDPFCGVAKRHLDVPDCGIEGRICNRLATIKKYSKQYACLWLACSKGKNAIWDKDTKKCGCDDIGGSNFKVDKEEKEEETPPPAPEPETQEPPTEPPAPRPEEKIDEQRLAIQGAQHRRVLEENGVEIAQGVTDKKLGGLSNSSVKTIAKVQEDLTTFFGKLDQITIVDTGENFIDIARQEGGLITRAIERPANFPDGIVENRAAKKLVVEIKGTSYILNNKIEFTRTSNAVWRIKEL